MLSRRCGARWQLSAPRERRRTVARLDQHEVGRLIEAAYRKGSRYGLMIKTLFYTGARVSEFINIQVVDLRLDLDPPQVYLACREGRAVTGMCPFSQRSLRSCAPIYVGGRRSTSSRATAIPAIPHGPSSSWSRDAAQRAGLAQRVTPHRLRASVATLLLDAGMPIDQVQKFLRHKHLSTTQIYAETSLKNLGEHYLRALS